MASLLFGRVRRPFSRVVFVGGACSLLATGWGCTALLGSDASQCSTDGDCATFGTDYVCSAGVCASRHAQEAGAPPPFQTLDGGSGGCTSNQQCINDNNGRASVCMSPGQPCLNIQTDDCPELAGGDYLPTNGAATGVNPDAVFMGVLLGEAAPDVAISFNAKLNWAAISVAANEIAQNLPGHGLPGGSNGARRPLVVLRCEDAADTTRAGTVAQFLTGTLGRVINVPLVVPTLDQEALGAAPVSANAPSKPATYCNNCLAPFRKEFTGSADTSQLFQSNPPVTGAAKGYADMVSYYETVIRATPGFTGDIKVAYITTQAVQQAALSDEVQAQLNFNGASVATNTTNGNYVFARYPGIAVGTDGPDVPSFLQPVLDLKPNVVILGLGTDATRVVIPWLESQWPSGQMRPNYIGMPAIVASATADGVGANDDLRKRIQGLTVVSAPADPNRATIINAKLANAFPSLGIVPTQPSSAYDQMYAWAYAIVAGTQSGQPVTGATISAGLAKLATTSAAEGGTATPYWVGPTDLSAVMSDLTNGNAINLLGVWSSFQRDATTGGPVNGRATAYCCKKNPATGLPFMSILPTYFDYPTQTFQNGTLPLACP